MSRKGSSRGEEDTVTTRLIPELKFGCDGIVIRLTVAVVNRNGKQRPKLQIWRENETLLGVYYKVGPDIPLFDKNNHMCVRRRLDGGIFRCTLDETFQFPVQSGDILGLELPSKSDEEFDIYFTQGGPTNYIFEGQINVGQLDLSEANQLTKDMPQLGLLVVIGKCT